MTITSASFYLGCVALIGSSVAHAAATTNYECALLGQGTCTDGPRGTCLGNRIIVSKSPVILKVSFQTGEVDLNGIHGKIVKPQERGASFVVWDLAFLGYPAIAQHQIDGRSLVYLSFQGRTASFACDPR